MRTLGAGGVVGRVWASGNDEKGERLGQSQAEKVFGAE